MSASVELRGTKELQRKLKATADRIENRAVRTALREGAKPVLAAMRGKARSKRVRKGLRVKFHSTARMLHSVEIGPNSKTAARASWEEKGTKAHDIVPKKKTVLYSKALDKFFPRVIHHPGAKARPFIKPAWEASKAEAIATASEYLGREIAAGMR